MSDRKRDKVSIIMGIYNCADTISDAIESVLCQTYNNIQLVMCDDGSDDETYSIAKAYQEKYPNKIKLLRHKSNLHLSAALNDCLAIADGKYIARMDADDISIPDRIEKQIAFLESNPEYQLVGTAMQMFNENGSANILRREPFPNKYSLKKSTCFSHATVMTYKWVYDELGGYTVSPRTQRGQDYDLWFRFFAKGFKGANLYEPLYKCREDMKAIRRRTFKSRVNNFLTMIYGYRLLHYPWYWYYIPVSELLKGFIPTEILYKLRQSKMH